jgi:hypothetical protein
MTMALVNLMPFEVAVRATIMAVKVEIEDLL